MDLPNFSILNAMARRCALEVLLTTLFLSVAHAQSCTLDLDLVFLLDTSGSICDDYLNDNGIQCGTTCTCPNFETIKTFMTDIVDQYPVGQGASQVKVAVITFGNRAQVVFHLDRYTTSDEVKQAIRALQYRPYQNTNTQEALYLMRVVVFGGRGVRPFVQNVAIVITDGRSSVNRLNTIPEAQRAQDAGILIYSVGMGMADGDELAMISSRTPVLGLTYWMQPDVDSLSDIIGNVVESSCPLDPCRELIVDMTFLIDSSGSICDEPPIGTVTCENYEWVKDFVIHLLERIPVGRTLTRVALVLFGNDAQVYFNLNRYYNTTSMMTSIRSLPYLNENTNTAQGLRRMMDQIYTGMESVSGDRPGVRNVAIVITDGQSTVNPFNTIPTATEAKQRGIEIYPIGITDEIKEAELRNMSSGSQLLNVDYFMSTSFEALNMLIGNLQRGVCDILQCQSEADVVFVLDASSSIKPDNFQVTKDWLIALLDRVEIDNGRTRVGVVVYSNFASTYVELNRFTDRAGVQQAVATLPYLRGTTNTADGLREAGRVFETSDDRPAGRNVAVLVTDGSSDNRVETTQVASQLKNSGVHLIVVGVGDWVDAYEVYNTASHPYRDNSLFLMDYSRFDSISPQLIDMLCNNADSCRTFPCLNGGTCVDLIGGYICNCPENMGGINCQYECREGADLVVALDSSYSIGRENFLLMTDFAAGLAMDLPTTEAVNIGLMAFSDTPQPFLYMGNGTKLNAMDAMSAPYSQLGTTDTAEALRYLTNNMFSGAGDRRSIKNVLVLVTDGYSDNSQAARQAARQARDAGITVIVVGVNTRNYPLRDEWESLASWPEQQNVHTVQAFSDLTALVPALRQAVCNNVDTCSPSQCVNFGDCVDRRNAYSCECYTGFTGRHCERRCDGLVDLVLILDRSGSIPIERFRQIRDMLSDLVQDLEMWGDRWRVALIVFDQEAVLEFDLDEYIGRLTEAAAHLRYNVVFTAGRSNLAQAYELAWTVLYSAERGGRSEAPDLVITFTDGGSTVRPQDTIAAATELKTRGARLVTMSVGRDLDMLELSGVTSSPWWSNLITTDSYLDLNEQFFQRVLGATCDSFNECLSNPCRNGGRCMDRYGDYYCDCPRDYSGRQCTRVCRGSNDIVLLLDVSGSLDSSLPLILNFTEHLVYGLEFKQDRNRLSLITFAQETHVRFLLNRHTTTRDYLNAIVFLERGGGTNTAAALRAARTQVLQTTGNRAGFGDTVVLVTDGGSNFERTQNIPEANLLKASGARIVAAPVGRFVDMAELNEIVSSPASANVLRNPATNDVTLVSTDDVIVAANQLLDSLCQT